MRQHRAECLDQSSGPSDGPCSYCPMESGGSNITDRLGVPPRTDLRNTAIGHRVGNKRCKGARTCARTHTHTHKLAKMHDGNTILAGIQHTTCKL